MITITVTIEEEASGGVAIGTKSVSIGTGKETIFAMAVIEAIRKAGEEVCGHGGEMRRNFSKIHPIGDG
jgi:hypothetical protein